MQTNDPRQQMEQDKENLKREGMNRARDKAAQGKERAASQLDSLSEAVDRAASSLSEQDKDSLASYVRKAGDQLSSLSQRLHERSVDELASDVKQLARSNPAAFMLGSVALGFGLSRFLKASESHGGQGRDRSSASSSRGFEGTGYASSASPGAGLAPESGSPPSSSPGL